MRLALETATDRASVALGMSAVGAFEGEIVGARRHAAGVVPMIDDLLHRAGATLDDLTAVVLSDGPGSFTGLRVGASVAKALVQARGLALWTAPSLMVRAAGAAHPGATVLAVSDALRGEVYAAAYRFDADAVITLLPPSVWHPDRLTGSASRPDLLVGDASEGAVRTLELWAGVALIRPPAGSPRARALLSLMDRTGGTVRVESMERWEPAYGRPAEAQARWETAHGRPLPYSVGSPG